VGGLADTVVHADPAALAAGRATGFVFDAATPAAFETAVRQALALRAQPAVWTDMMRRGMGQDLSWRRPAQEYLALYALARQA
jgi:starch synthase